MRRIARDRRPIKSWISAFSAHALRAHGSRTMDGQSLSTFAQRACELIGAPDPVKMEDLYSMNQQVSELNQQQIVDGLRTLGLHVGIGVMIHSSLRSFGRVNGGAETVVDALMEVVTPAGTLMMPSFNHGEPFGESGPGLFDPQTTRTTNGTIPDRFWRRPNVYRSLNPTHAFAAWGKHARRYTEHHHRTLTMGPNSPLGLLLEDDGYGLLLGVDYRSNTFHHVVEMFNRRALPGPAHGSLSDAVGRRTRRRRPHLGLARFVLPVDRRPSIWL